MALRCLRKSGKLTLEAVGAHYAALMGQDKALQVDRFSVPGFSALNFVVNSSMDGGVLAAVSIDCVAKGRAQLLLEFPVPVSAALRRKLAQ